MSSNDSRFKTEEERKESTRAIMKQLSGMGLGVQFPPIKQLYGLLSEHNKTGSRIKISIPFPEANRRIVGILSNGKREDSYVNLKYEKYD